MLIFLKAFSLHIHTEKSHAAVKEVRDVERNQRKSIRKSFPVKRGLDFTATTTTNPDLLFSPNFPSCSFFSSCARRASDKIVWVRTWFNKKKLSEGYKTLIYAFFCGLSLYFVYCCCGGNFRNYVTNLSLLTNLLA